MVLACFAEVAELIRLDVYDAPEHRCFSINLRRGLAPNPRYADLHVPSEYGVEDARYSHCVEGRRLADAGLWQRAAQPERLEGQLEWVSFREIPGIRVPETLSLDGSIQLGDLVVRLDPSLRYVASTCP